MKTGYTLTTEEIKSIESLNVKQVWNELTSLVSKEFEGNDKLWNDVVLFILEVVSENGEGFKKDIAEKALDYVNISEKQAWCVAYEFVKINS